MKKKLSLILASVLALSMLTVPVNAEENSAKITRATNVISTSVTADGAVDYEYQWVYREDASGEYIELPADTKSTYHISPRDKNRYINCEITPVYEGGEKGTPFYADADIQITELDKQSRSSYDSYPFPKTTPEENTFAIDGYARRYIMLDWFHDEDAAFFVLQDDLLVQTFFDTQEGHIKFDTTCETNIGYALNSEEMRTTGKSSEYPTAQTVDSKILSHIDWNHEWWTEKGIAGGETEGKDYSFTAGISVLSFTEALKYYDKIGADPKENSSWWWTRTQRANGSTSVTNVMVMKPGNKSEIWPIQAHVLDGSTSVVPFIRLAFYLNEDFFREIKLTVFDSDGNDILGDNVKNMLMQKYTYDELAQLYSVAELEAIGFSAPARPVITVTTNTGYPTILTASMEEENVVSYNYQWVIRSSQDESYVDLPGDRNQTYSISTLDDTKYLNCRVTPVYANGSMGVPMLADTDHYVRSLGQFNRTNGANYLSPISSPVENTFKVSGQQRKYILLDQFNDTASAFFIMDDFSYGKVAYGTEGNSKFDPTTEGNLGYTLNSDDFKQNGLGGEKLNTQIRDYINWNHVWWTEAGASGGQVGTSDYSFTAGMALISVSEWYKYHDKIGYDVLGNNAGWWTRSQRGISPGTDKNNILAMKTNDQSMWGTAVTDTSHVRPVYFLNEDFFRSVKLTDIGENVKKVIRSRYEKSELSKLYTENELEDMGFPPSISLVKTDNGIYTPEQLKVLIDYVPATDSDDIYIYAECQGKEQILYEGWADEGPIYGEFNIETAFGEQNFTVTIEEAGIERATLEATVNAVPSVVSDYGQVGIGSGIAMSILDQENSEEHIDNLKDLGFNNVRIEFTWSGRMEPVKGEYDTDRFKNIMQALKDNDMSVTALLAYNNPLYSGDTASNKNAIDTQEEIDGFVNYAKKLISTYPQIEKVEVWNEPNSPSFWKNESGTITETDMQNYTNLVKAVSKELKKISPNINVYAGAIDVSKQPIEYISGMLNAGAYEAMDTLSYHQYYHPYTVDTAERDGFVEVRIKPYKKILRDFGGFKQLSATEFGYSPAAFSSFSEEDKKREVPKAYIVMVANNIDSADLYTYMGTEGYEMFTTDTGAVTPLAFTMAQLNHELNGTSFVGKLPTEAGTTAYVFEKDGSPVIVAWSSNDASLTVNGANAKAFDVYGNAAEITNSEITLSLDPIYIENASTDYFKLASDNEIAKRKEAITEYFIDLPQNIADAITNDAENIKTLIKESNLTNVQKSALLDMIYEVEMIKATYAAINDSSNITIPTQRYENVKAEADNDYAKAAVAYVKRYITEAENAVAANAPETLIAKNVAIAEALLDSAQVLIDTSTEAKIEISNVSKENGVLNFDIINTTDKDVVIYVATYTGTKLQSVEIADLNNLSFNVGDSNGTIFVWEANTLKPLVGKTDF